MDVISGRVSSALNPYAAPFVPGAYRVVADFSPEWWQLVESSAGFRDYWLRECYQESPPQDDDPELMDIYEPVLPDADSLFHSYPPQKGKEEEEEEEEEEKEGRVATWGADKWRGPRGRSDGPKYFEKAPKLVSVKVSPRAIQQPR